MLKIEDRGSRIEGRQTALDPRSSILKRSTDDEGQSAIALSLRRVLFCVPY
jgi:hypothetical protein